MPEKVQEMGFQELLQILMPTYKIKRSKEIKDKEVVIQEVTDERVKALIRNYHLLIDLKNQMILHDCADWSRCVPIKQFCKHVGKVMMTIPKEKAVEILKRICSQREEWEFKPYVA